MQMHIWHDLVHEGDQFLRKGAYKEAESKYYEALNNAKLSLFLWETPEGAVRSLIVSYQSLTEAYIKQKLPKEAASYLLEGLAVFKQLLFTVEENSPWYYACLKGKQDLTEFFRLFLKKCPNIKICPNCYQEIFYPTDLHPISKLIH